MDDDFEEGVKKSMSEPAKKKNKAVSSDSKSEDDKDNGWESKFNRNRG